MIREMPRRRSLFAGEQNQRESLIQYRQHTFRFSDIFPNVSDKIQAEEEKPETLLLCSLLFNQ